MSEDRAVDALILDIARGGDVGRAAVDRLYRLYAARFGAWLRRRELAVDEVEDLVQEAFVRIVRGAPGFRANGQGAAWLWTVARSAWRDAWRQRRPEHGAVDIADLPDGAIGQSADIAAGAIFADCVHGQLARFLARYPEGGQAVLWAALDGLSTAAIADQLERSAGATRQFLSQTRQRLREYLAPCLD